MKSRMVVRVLSLVGFVIGAASIPVHAQQRSAEALLQEALHQELVAGDLLRAASLYKDLVATYPRERHVAAKALVNLGRTYEKLGKEEALAAYERVTRDYADQSEPLRFARSRLQSLTGTDGSKKAATGGGQTMVFADLPPLRPNDNAQYDFSPAGDRIVIRHEADGRAAVPGISLFITNNSGTVIDTLVAPQRQRGRISPRWSPDGKYVAYIERSFTEAESTYAALMIVPAEGGAPRVLTTALDPANAPATGGLFWTPDGSGITVAMKTQLVTFDLRGLVVRSIPMQLPYQTQVTGYSPDGRWMALHHRNAGTDQQNEKDVWIMPAVGGRAIQLTHSPGYDGWPVWGPDGRSVYFVSDRSGSMNIWSIGVDPSSGLPKGEAEQVTMYADASALYPKLIAGGKKLAFALVRETSVIHVAASDKGAPRRAVTRGQKPFLSPDGRTVYYEGQGSDQRGIFAVTVAGGQARRLTTTRPAGPEAFQSYALSPDGRTIAYFSVSGSANVLYTVSTSGEAPRELTRFDSHEELVPSWSPAGDRLAYAHANGLFVISASGGEQSKIAHLYSWDGWSVRWSPDGAHVAALGWTSPADQNAVFVVPAKGGDARRLTSIDERGYKEGLEWHPDGQRLTYMYYGHDERGDGTRITHLDGRPSVLLVDQPPPLWDYIGVWNPEGSKYFFISASGSRGWDLYAYDESLRAAGLFSSREDNSPGTGLPSFSRDGRTMAWPVTRTTRQLWVVDTKR